MRSIFKYVFVFLLTSTVFWYLNGWLLELKEDNTSDLFPMVFACFHSGVLLLLATAGINQGQPSIRRYSIIIWCLLLWHTALIFISNDKMFFGGTDNEMLYGVIILILLLFFLLYSLILKSSNVELFDVPFKTVASKNDKLGLYDNVTNIYDTINKSDKQIQVIQLRSGDHGMGKSTMLRFVAERFLNTDDMTVITNEDKLKALYMYITPTRSNDSDDFQQLFQEKWTAALQRHYVFQFPSWLRSKHLNSILRQQKNWVMQLLGYLKLMPSVLFFLANKQFYNSARNNPNTYTQRIGEMFGYITHWRHEHFVICIDEVERGSDEEVFQIFDLLDRFRSLEHHNLPIKLVIIVAVTIDKFKIDSYTSTRMGHSVLDYLENEKQFDRVYLLEFNEKQRFKYIALQIQSQIVKHPELSSKFSWDGRKTECSEVLSNSDMYHFIYKWGKQENHFLSFPDHANILHEILTIISRTRTIRNIDAIVSDVMHLLHNWPIEDQKLDTVRLADLFVWVYMTKRYPKLLTAIETNAFSKSYENAWSKIEPIIASYNPDNNIVGKSKDAPKIHKKIFARVYDYFPEIVDIIRTDYTQYIEIITLFWYLGYDALKSREHNDDVYYLDRGEKYKNSLAHKEKLNILKSIYKQGSLQKWHNTSEYIQRKLYSQFIAAKDTNENIRDFLESLKTDKDDNELEQFTSFCLNTSPYVRSNEYLSWAIIALFEFYGEKIQNEKPEPDGHYPFIFRYCHSAAAYMETRDSGQYLDNTKAFEQMIEMMLNKMQSLKGQPMKSLFIGFQLYSFLKPKKQEYSRIKHVVNNNQKIKKRLKDEIYKSFLLVSDKQKIKNLFQSQGEAGYEQFVEFMNTDNEI